MEWDNTLILGLGGLLITAFEIITKLNQSKAEKRTKKQIEKQQKIEELRNKLNKKKLLLERSQTILLLELADYSYNNGANDLCELISEVRKAHEVYEAERDNIIEEI